MHPHSYPSPPRIIAPGGPVSAAIRTMREANDLPPLLAEHFDAETLEIHVLRDTIRRQLQADFDRIDRCLVILDTLGGDDELEADYYTREMGPEGYTYVVCRSSDDEPSLCSTGVSHPGQPVNGHNCGRDLDDIELVDSDNEDGGDSEPSLCGLTVQEPSPGGFDEEAGDDNGMADDGGMNEQLQRYLSLGGNMNRLPRGVMA